MITLLFAACSHDELDAGDRDVARVVVEEIAAVDLDMVMPSDLLWRSDGDLLVLDGYAGRILAFGADGSPKGTFSKANVGRPVRLSGAADGGVWAVVPGLDDEAGLLVHLDAAGNVDDTVAPLAQDGAVLHPVDVLDLGDQMVVADREGGLGWIDPTTGRGVGTLRRDADGVDLRRVVDLAADADGGAIAVDTLGPRLLDVTRDGVPGTSTGRSGTYAGRLWRPSSAAVVPGGGRFVTDSELDVVSAFEADGDFVGLLSTFRGPLRFEHPVAVRVAGESPAIVAVLDARPARLHLYRLAGPLPPAPEPALLRTTLVEPDKHVGGDEGATCLQCHDGLVRDSREVWDPTREHHPVRIVPERDLPDLFPLDESGEIACSTCHSPHGVVDPARADTDAAPLVRHRSAGSPFLRLERDADALCLACHADNPHEKAGSAALAGAGAGHPVGDALVAALDRRKQQGEDTGDPTKGSCLSCHAMHGATGESILRDPGDGATCLGCHRAVGVAATNHPLGRLPGSDLVAERRGTHLSLARDGGIGCLTCHDLNARAKSLVRTLDDGRAVCLDCHATREDIEGGGHAALTGRGAPTCVACHDVHGGERDASFLVAGPKTAGDPTGCLGCHGPGKRAAPDKAAPGRKGHPVDGRTFDGEDRLTCTSCHDAHAADQPREAACASCHEEEGEAKKRGGHGEAGCLDCHPAHAPTPLAAVKKVNPSSQRCLACHGPDAGDPDAPKVEDWEHPAPVFKEDGTRWTPLGGLVLYGKEGTPAPAGENGDLACRTCHVVHGPEKSGEDNLRRAGGWKEACASCHDDEALVLYRYFHQPQRRADLREGEL
ncbi:MAG: cytochrome c3 family protein [Myxococcota bacterium]